jgi:hypothetical protein
MNQNFKKFLLKTDSIVKISGFLFLFIAIPLTTYAFLTGNFLFGAQAKKPPTGEECAALEGVCSPPKVCIKKDGTPLGSLDCRKNSICCFFGELPTPTPLPQTNKRVFLTSTTYDGNLGGLAGADEKCQARANAANLGGTWRAWLSDSQTSASSRITQTNGKYVLLNGQTVANNWADLVDGTIQNPINVNEFMGSPNYKSCVWTSTKADGSAYLPVANITLCSDYTAADTNYSICGHNGVTGSEWTNWSSDRCDQFHPLFCFER